MDSKSRNDISDLFVRMPERRWGFLQTRPRHEKQALSDLTAQGLIVYLPLITKVEIHKGISIYPRINRDALNILDALKEHHYGS